MLLLLSSFAARNSTSSRLLAAKCSASNIILSSSCGRVVVLRNNTSTIHRRSLSVLATSSAYSLNVAVQVQVQFQFQFQTQIIQSSSYYYYQAYQNIQNIQNIQNQQRRSLHLTPREIDHLQLYQCGVLAQNRLARGLRLNVPESIALITSQMMERIRDGKYNISDLMIMGQSLLGLKQVLPGVASIIKDVQIEATFNDGTKLLTIHSPICKLNGNLSLALKGSFLPIPDLSVFELDDEENGLEEEEEETEPGLVTTCDDSSSPGIILNKLRLDTLIELSVTNTGDRPIQVGSHYAFLETNKALEFDRIQSIGKRLNIPSGSSVRFEPGEIKTITLIDIGGKQKIISGNRLHNGSLDTNEIMKRVILNGFKHSPASSSLEEIPITVVKGQPCIVSRSTYNDMYGPTIGDKIKLGDTKLIIEIENDLTTYGEECKFGGGKTLREGMGQSTSVQSDKALDVVITNALIVDSVTGIIKADVGIKGNRIVGIGKAGNPDMMDGVTPGMIIGGTTDVIAGEKLILTAGGIDTHVHYICPQQFDDAVASGLTTMFGGGTGPSAGTSATTCTPAPSQFEMMLKATDGIAMNFGFSGKGNVSDNNVLKDCLLAGASGFKLHEDWGTTPSAIDSCLSFADEHDIAVTIHTDTLNESGFVDDSIAAMKGRTIHTYHTEGAGGGHAPDIIKIVQEPYVLPSSTNPTRPFTINTMDEHLDMLMVCHHLDSSIQEDVAFAESRIRAETIAAEDILHDLGAISIISSDSQAMGRVGEVITRTWQTADKMKYQRGPLVEDSGNNNDNTRVKRYLAKYTINPAITHGMSHLLGSIEVNKFADLVLWKPCYFGTKPEMIIKGGAISYSQMGDPNASIPTPQPVKMRPMFGSMASQAEHSIAFVSKAAADNNIGYKYGLNKKVEAVHNCRNVTKYDMVLNDLCPKMHVNPDTFEVYADGELLTCEPLEKVPLARKYFLF